MLLVLPLRWSFALYLTGWLWRQRSLGFQIT